MRAGLVRKFMGFSGPAHPPLRHLAEHAGLRAAVQALLDHAPGAPGARGPWDEIADEYDSRPTAEMLSDGFATKV